MDNRHRLNVLENWFSNHAYAVHYQTRRKYLGMEFKLPLKEREHDIIGITYAIAIQSDMFSGNVDAFVPDSIRILTGSSYCSSDDTWNKTEGRFEALRDLYRKINGKRTKELKIDYGNIIFSQFLDDPIILKRFWPGSSTSSDKPDTEYLDNLHNYLEYINPDQYLPEDYKCNTPKSE